MIGDVQVRLLRQADAELMSAAYQRNREHLAPWEPERSEHFFTPDGQSEVISAKMDMHAAGSELPWVLQVGDRIVGCLTLTGIVRGPFLSAHIGYWVDSAFTGKRLASAAVAFAVETAGRDLGLHRLQAATLVQNAASQKVLNRAGFEQIGLAPAYLRIAGVWQDHRLYQRLMY